MATKKPTAPAKKPPVSPATNDETPAHAADSPALPANAPADATTKVTNAGANAQRSLIDALQAELAEERLRSLTSRTQLERQITSLELTLDELRAELAQATAHSRELEAQLQQLRGAR